MDAYSELSKSLTSEQIEQEVDAKIRSFHGLLTREVALRIIAKEKGLLKEEEKICKISEIPKGARKICVVARAEKIMPEVVYPSGKRSRSILLKDETGEMRLKLWEEDIPLCSRIRTGSQLAIRGAYEKFGDLNLGYRGSVEIISGNGFTPLGSLPDSGAVHVYAKVSKIIGDSENAFWFSVSDSRTEVRAKITDGRKRGKKMQEEDLVIIDNARAENGMLVLDSNSRLLLKRRKDLVSGKLDSLEEENGLLRVEIGEKRLAFDRENAMKFLGAMLPKDIELGTLVELKKNAILHSPLNLKVREENGRFIILE